MRGRRDAHTIYPASTASAVTPSALLAQGGNRSTTRRRLRRVDHADAEHGQIADVFANRLGQQRVDQPNDRRIVGLLKQVFGLGHGVGKRCKVHLVAEIGHHLAGL